MASLGHFFGLGVEEHRALADARMTLEVLRNAGCICFLERGCAAAMDGEDTAAAAGGAAAADGAAAVTTAATPLLRSTQAVAAAADRTCPIWPPRQVL